MLTIGFVQKEGGGRECPKLLIAGFFFIFKFVVKFTPAPFISRTLRNRNLRYLNKLCSFWQRCINFVLMDLIQSRVVISLPGFQMQRRMYILHGRSVALQI